MSNIVRSEGDPKILRTGPSSLSSSDRLARALGWFSIGLGVTELLWPRSITRRLGMEGKERLIRVFGAREIMAGVLSLSLEKRMGLSSRVIGDGLDIATLLGGLRKANGKSGNVVKALAAVAGITLLDIVGAAATGSRRKQSSGERSYRDRTGFPQGIERARGAARATRMPTAASA
jgi:hypothetical protein